MEILWNAHHNVCVRSVPSVVSTSLRARLLCPQGFSRQDYWSGLPCPHPGHLPNPGIEPASPSLQADSLPTEPPGKPHHHSKFSQYPSPPQSHIFFLLWWEFFKIYSDSNFQIHTPVLLTMITIHYGFYSCRYFSHINISSLRGVNVSVFHSAHSGSVKTFDWSNCLVNPMDRGYWLATVHVIESQTQLKRLSTPILHTFIPKSYIYFLCFNWKIIGLQYCIGFCCTTTQISHNYVYICVCIYILSFLSLVLTFT